MSADTLLAGFARTRPATYTVAGDVSDECRDAFVLKHWTEPIEILVVRPTGANYVTFSKHVNGELTVRITTPISVVNGKVLVPDAVLCWDRLRLFNSRSSEGEITHLIIRNEKVFVQPKRRGSDARGRGSDASRGSGDTGAPAPVPARDPATRSPARRTRTRPGSGLRAPGTAPRVIVDPPHVLRAPRTRSQLTAGQVATIRAGLDRLAGALRRRLRPGSPDRTN